MSIVGIQSVRAEAIIENSTQIGYRRMNLNAGTDRRSSFDNVQGTRHALCGFVKLEF